MTQANAAPLEQQYILWNGFLVPVDFPYLNTLLLGRPRHTMDDFFFRHPQMDQGKRAKVFAPFDALDGYGESISEKNTVYTDKIILDESEKEELNRRLTILHNLTCNSRMAKANRVVVTVKHYVPCADEHSFACGIRGQYRTETGVVWKVDMEVSQTITVGRKSISFGDIVSVTTDNVRLFDLYLEDSFSPCQ